MTVRWYFIASLVLLLATALSSWSLPAPHPILDLFGYHVSPDTAPPVSRNAKQFNKAVESQNWNKIPKMNLKDVPVGNALEIASAKGETDALKHMLNDGKHSIYDVHRARKTLAADKKSNPILDDAFEQHLKDSKELDSLVKRHIISKKEGKNWKNIQELRKFIRNGAKNLDEDKLKTLLGSAASQDQWTIIEEALKKRQAAVKPQNWPNELSDYVYEMISKQGNKNVIDYLKEKQFLKENDETSKQLLKKEMNSKLRDEVFGKLVTDHEWVDQSIRDLFAALNENRQDTAKKILEEMPLKNMDYFKLVKLANEMHLNTQDFFKILVADQIKKE